MLNFSLSEKQKDGVEYRLEYLPFDNNSFDTVFVVGAWEVVLQPSYALLELFRITSKTLVICYRTGSRLPWQTIQMEDEKSWKDFTQSIKVVMPNNFKKISNDYSAVIWNNLNGN